MSDEVYRLIGKLSFIPTPDSDVQDEPEEVVLSFEEDLAVVLHLRVAERSKSSDAKTERVFVEFKMDLPLPEKVVGAWWRLGDVAAPRKLDLATSRDCITDGMLVFKTVGQPIPVEVQVDIKGGNTSNDCLDYGFKFLADPNQPTDVILKCDGFELPVHKAILAGQSPLFKTMLEKDLSKDGVLEIKDMNSYELKYLLNFLYTKRTLEWRDHKPTVRKMLKMAKTYGVPDLAKTCNKFLK